MIIIENESLSLSLEELKIIFAFGFGFHSVFAHIGIRWMDGRAVKTRRLPWPRNKSSDCQQEVGGPSQGRKESARIRVTSLNPVLSLLRFSLTLSKYIFGSICCLLESHLREREMLLSSRNIYYTHGHGLSPLVLWAKL
jgi:hypothetical protein